MSLNHHPHAESLMSCAAGSMPEAFAAVMASHLLMCPTCQRETALMQDIGITLFDQLNATPVTTATATIAMRAGDGHGDAAAEGRVPFAAFDGDVAQLLALILKCDLATVPWRQVAPGVAQHVISLKDSSRASLRLIKVAPGKALPEHAHSGSELTMIVNGSYTDETGEYRAGDIADMTGDVSHSPVADPVTGCVCLVATEGKLKFKSIFARFVQPFAGI